MITNSENNSLLKQPSVWIPLAMSFVALAFLLSYVAIYGFANGSSDGDEGAPARIFQLIMAAQLPIAGYFAIKWLPKEPKQSLLILGLQAVAWIIPILAVMWFESL
ncbi:MAG: hypothetical protein HND47_12875 [Chloroflexi bacterium]|nr:hypothetical protein [Chloroflexota bacterium]